MIDDTGTQTHKTYLVISGMPGIFVRGEMVMSEAISHQLF
jgi:hypothetical protein